MYMYVWMVVLNRGETNTENLEKDEYFGSSDIPLRNLWENGFWFS